MAGDGAERRARFDGNATQGEVTHGKATLMRGLPVRLLDPRC